MSLMFEVDCILLIVNLHNSCKTVCMEILENNSRTLRDMTLVDQE